MSHSLPASFRRAGCALAWCCLIPLGAATMAIKPGFRIVLSGEQAAFSVPGEEPCRWSLAEPEGGSVSPAGRYLAPDVAAVRAFHLRAERLGGPAEQAEATVLVLPREPFGAPAAPASDPSGPGELPFLDPATDQRRGEGAQVQCWRPPGSAISVPRQIVGCGLPLVLRWPPGPAGAGAQLSYREGGRWVRREVTGLGSVVLHPMGPIGYCGLETLDRSRRPGAYYSHFLELPVSVRGLLPLAGDPAAAGHGDGQGGTARFREPFGLALVGCGQFASRQVIVADRASHVVRAVSAGGEVGTPWGRAFEPGYRDGTGCARFNGPTFVAALPCGAPPWEPFAGFLVADSGNHVIRRVDGRGEVATLAGTAGQAGFRDADDPRRARFSDPRGLALDARGNVYVADRGNHVIRRIGRDGQVTTLAGEPGRSGTRDGQGPQARFSGLQGLAVDGDALVAADGHALRRITLAGEVTTILGVPDRAGFRDGREAGREPCLDTPCGLAAAGGRLYIADLGNRALREFDPAAGTLRTLAGDPGLGGNRPGLLRDGIPGPLGGAYAGLEAPRGLAAGDLGQIYVATGPWLAQACRERLPAAAPGPAGLVLASRSVRRDAPLAVDWTVPAHRPEEEPVLYTLAFIQADGAAERKLGTALGGGAVREEGRFALPGPGRVVLQWVTRQGVSRGAEAIVQVE